MKHAVDHRRHIGRDVSRRVLFAALMLFAIGSADARLLDRPRAAAVPSKSYALEVGGRVRTYRLYVPHAYAGKPVPLLVVLHPALGDGAGMERLTHFDELAEARNFIVAYPDGVNRRWNAGRCCGRPMAMQVDDVGFIEAVVAAAGRQYHVDPMRKYLAGFSNGAFLAHHVACLKPDAFTAYAVTGGAITTANCPDAKPTPMLVIHGTVDPRSPWNGGTAEGVYRPPVIELMHRLARRNHCENEENVTYRIAPATCRTFAGCGSNEVTYCALEGVGHQWAGSGQAVLPVLLGPNTDRFDTSRAMWDFFERHPRKGA
jgi:polyhydroxybutyrate depolymerase